MVFWTITYRLLALDKRENKERGYLVWCFPSCQFAEGETSCIKRSMTCPRSCCKCVAILARNQEVPQVLILTLSHSFILQTIIEHLLWSQQSWKRRWKTCLFTLPGGASDTSGSQLLITGPHMQWRSRKVLWNEGMTIRASQGEQCGDKSKQSALREFRVVSTDPQGGKAF